ncbi:STM4011 family radical SAM protein [Flavobacterium oreochromis]|uniref:Radical SAM protein n=1 Tax=Flavobacterium columnare TaxID=996 RepID=A0A2D0AHU7_9FLAO|nr:STM4011 family radical SAM protein [Flavobacterium oreochromis]OWP77688.1 radical SAM protein [Flavobacterium oreochromis]
MNWSILYRGTLSGCNYSCNYCPFAKTKDSKEVLKQDALDLQRFVDWVGIQKQHSIGVLFTPWGEGLIRKQYQEAIFKLSKMPHVNKVSIQTNLTCSLTWLEKVNKIKVALWVTYHPTQINRSSFLEKCHQLDQMGIKHSVGVVGFKNVIDEIEEFKAQLNPSTYLWINVDKETTEPYTDEEVARMKKIDPYVGYNLIDHISKDLACKAGHTTFSVNGNGDITRCHFIKNVIGNIYDSNFEQSLYPRLCTNTICNCHIGYVHLDTLKLDEVYGDQILERIPLQF